MAINFPDSPSTNDTHVVGDKTWIWNGTYWHVKQGVGVTIWADADSDTKIQVEESSDEDIIRFDTAGTERMTIAANGAVNVGGTLTAGAFSGPLTGNVTGNASGTALTVTQAAQSAITSVGTLTSATITGDLTVDTSTLKVDSSNNRVGIGTASPTYRLQVAHTGNSNQGYFEGGWDDNVNSNSRLIFNDHNFGIGAGQIGGGSNEDDLVLWGYNGAGRGISFKGTSDGQATTFQSMDAWMRITEGKVGIGDTTPDAKLDVYHNANNEWVAIFDQDHATGYGVKITGDMTATNDALLKIEAGSTQVFRMTQVGLMLGTPTTPTNLLSIDVGLNDTKGLSLDYSGEAKAGMLLNPNSGEVRMGAINSTGDYFTTLYADNAEAMRIDKDGKVGIGTTAPTTYSSTSLHIAGSGTTAAIKFTNTSTGAANTDGFDLESNGVDFNFVLREAGALKFWTSTAHRMTLSAAGNLGIGESSPSGILDLANGTGRKLFMYHGSGANTAGFGIDVSGTGYELSAWCAYSSGSFHIGQHDGSTSYSIARFTRPSSGGRLTMYGYGTSEGGEIALAGGSSFGTEFYFDRYGDDIRWLWGGVNKFQIEPTGSLNFGDAGQLKCGNGNDLLIYANGSHSFIDHNGDGNLWIRTNAAGEHIYLDNTNGGTGSKILIQRNGHEQMEFREGATTHTGANDADAEHGGVGFAAAGIYIDRHWLGNPGITICNSNVNSSTISSQGTFRFHGSNHSYASYPAAAGNDFGISVVCDGTFSPTSDERRKTDIEDITGALASVNALRGRMFKFKNSNLETEEPGSIGGKLYGLIAQEALDVVPHAIWDDGEEPLENGWCRSMRMDYGAVTAVLVEAIKELTTRLEALEAL